MQRRTHGGAARAYDAQEATAAQPDPEDKQAPHAPLAVADDPAGPDPIVPNATFRPSNQLFGWLVGAGLALLVVLLAAVLFHAGVNVEVLP